MAINDKLRAVQVALKAPKGQYNDFGKYSYRSCEDILEAVKPLLADNELTLTISDKVEVVGTRTYVVATATLRDGDQYLTVSATAREPESKKGMDESQITGCASSYARKYALNGLFLIDDTKDADTMDNREPKFDKRKELQRSQERCKAALTKVAERDGFDPKKAWADIQKRPDFANEPGYWLAVAVEYEMS